MKMEDWEALVEWQSGGLNDVPTENILSLLKELQKELIKRKAEGNL